jgi:hypothetical protein
MLMASRKVAERPGSKAHNRPTPWRIGRAFGAASMAAAGAPIADYLERRESKLVRTDHPVLLRLRRAGQPAFVLEIVSPTFLSVVRNSTSSGVRSCPKVLVSQGISSAWIHHRPAMSVPGGSQGWLSRKTDPGFSSR